jgi:HK97 family phage portal protein
MDAVAVARSWWSAGTRAGSSLMAGLGFGVGNRQPALGPLFTEYGFDRTIGGDTHAFDPLDGTGWQRNLQKLGGGALPVVEAIYTLYANAFAQLRPHHRRTDLESGEIVEVTGSPAARLLVQPNAYESGATLLSRIACDWLAGEALVIALIDGRNEPQSLHLMPRGTWSPRVDPLTREIFYFVSNDEDLLFSPQTQVADVEQGRLFVVPARNAMHLRWRTPRHPLVGESPYAAAGLAAGVNVALSRTQMLFVENMRRVSTVLSTDQILNREQIAALRDAFDVQATKWATGGLPILAGGLKMSSANLTAIDESIIGSLRFSNEEVARCAGVPPPMYGDLSAGSVTSSETLVRHWLSVSLGGLIERLEREFDRLFRLDGRRDLVEMSTEALLRSDLASQAEALSKLVQGGVLYPDEARKQLGQGPADGGNQLFVQRQMVPITLAVDLAKADLDKATAPPPPPVPAPPTVDPAAPPAVDPAQVEAMQRSLETLAGRVQRVEVAANDDKVDAVQRSLEVLAERTQRIESAVDEAEVDALQRSLETLVGRTQRLEAVAERPGVEPIADFSLDAEGLLHLVPRTGPPLTARLPNVVEMVRQAAEATASALRADLEAQLAVAVARNFDARHTPPRWEAQTVYTEGQIVDAYIGRTYRVRAGVAATIGQEPGDHPEQWERLGSLGLRVFKHRPATLQPGDTFTEAESRFLHDGESTILFVPRAAKVSDIERAVKGPHALAQDAQAQLRDQAARLEAVARDARASAASTQDADERAILALAQIEQLREHLEALQRRVSDVEGAP